MSTFNYVYQGKSYSENDLIQAAFQWAVKQKEEGAEGWKNFDFENTKIRVGDSNYQKLKKQYIAASDGAIVAKLTKNKKQLNKNTEKLYNSKTSSVIDFKKKSNYNNQQNNQTSFYQVNSEKIDLGYGTKKNNIPTQPKILMVVGRKEWELEV